MKQRALGLAGIILLMLAVAAWVLIPKNNAASVQNTSPSVAVPKSGNAIQAAPIQTKIATSSSLDPWTRPPANVAARNARRVRFSSLRQYGASDQIVNRLTDGDMNAVIQGLKRQAQQGDATAGNLLYRMVRFECAFARMRAARQEAGTPPLQEAQALPPEDAAWLTVAVRDKNNTDKALADACSQIDRGEAEGWMNKGADDGNPASLYLRYMFRPNQGANLSERQLQEAVDAGYAEAQAFLAQRLAYGAPGLPVNGEGADNLFKQASANLPYAESQWAICEFNGCAGIDVDITAAVAHARDAAQHGDFVAMNTIGPKLQASQIDPDEVQAWSLVAAVLAQQGCSSNSLSVQNMSSWMSALSSKTLSSQARELAEGYWRDYGSQMMSGIGCAD